MKQNATPEGLLVRAEPLEWAQEISHRMVDVVRVEDGALLLDAEPKLAGAINTVLASKGVKVKRNRKKRGDSKMEG
jgi:hypothetical protein